MSLLLTQPQIQSKKAPVLALKKGQLERPSLHRMYMAFEVLRTKEREFPAQLVVTFLYICTHNGCRQEDLIEATSMTSSSVSRNVTWLGPKHRLGKDGLRWIYREVDPIDPKRYRLYLSRKGEQIAKLLEQTLESPV